MHKRPSRIFQLPSPPAAAPWPCSLKTFPPIHRYIGIGILVMARPQPYKILSSDTTPPELTRSRSSPGIEAAPMPYVKRIILPSILIRRLSSVPILPSPAPLPMYSLPISLPRDKAASPPGHGILATGLLPINQTPPIPTLRPVIIISRYR